MRNNETGEFELVVGNRQLLSGFFIVVLLFAVAFAMGYVVGQNSPRSAKLQADAASNTSAPTALDSRPQPVTATPVATQPPATPPADANAQTTAPATAPAPTEPQPTTQPAANTQAAAPVAKSAPAPAPAVSESLAPGSYLQVMALNQADADVVMRTLKDKGFPALMTPGRNNLMRVLVGPYDDSGAMGKAKTALENAGFHPFKLPNN